MYSGARARASEASRGVGELDGGAAEGDPSVELGEAGAVERSFGDDELGGARGAGANGGEAAVVGGARGFDAVVCGFDPSLRGADASAGGREGDANFARELVELGLGRRAPRARFVGAMPRRSRSRSATRSGSRRPPSSG